MVKINLSRDSLSQAAHKKKDAADAPAEIQPNVKPDGNSKPVGAIVLFLLFAGLGGLYSFWLNGNIKREKMRNTSLAADKEKFEPYLKLEQQFRDQKETLEKKEEVLIKLKKQQQLPVYFLQELGNSIPENVWLVKINSKGGKVEIKAETLTEDAIYQFRDGLAAKAQWFKNVDYPGATRAGKRLEFTLTFDLINSV